jgi:hypothetical protein
MNGPHLDDEQFTSYLLDECLDAEGTHHLMVCPLCRTEFERFKSLISGFDQDTLRWSEARVAGSVVKPSWLADEWRTLVRWAVAACFVLAMLLSVMVFSRSGDYKAANKGAHPVKQNSKEQIVSDNQVLTGIYQEITAPVTVPMEDYGFPAERSKANSRVE